MFDKCMKELDLDQIIVVFGSYGYDWVYGQNVEVVMFQDVMDCVVDVQVIIDFDDDMQNLYFFYSEDNGIVYDLWFFDVVIVYNQIYDVDGYQFYGYVVW